MCRPLLRYFEGTCGATTTPDAGVSAHLKNLNIGANTNTILAKLEINP